MSATGMKQVSDPTHQWTPPERSPLVKSICQDRVHNRICRLLEEVTIGGRRMGLVVFRDGEGRWTKDLVDFETLDFMEGEWTGGVSGLEVIPL